MREVKAIWSNYGRILSFMCRKTKSVRMRVAIGDTHRRHSIIHTTPVRLLQLVQLQQNVVFNQEANSSERLFGRSGFAGLTNTALEYASHGVVTVKVYASQEWLICCGVVFRSARSCRTHAVTNACGAGRAV